MAKKKKKRSFFGKVLKLGTFAGAAAAAFLAVKANIRAAGEHKTISDAQAEEIMDYIEKEKKKENCPQQNPEKVLEQEKKVSGAEKEKKVPPEKATRTSAAELSRYVDGKIAQLQKDKM